MLSVPLDHAHVLYESAWSSSVPALGLGAEPRSAATWSEVSSEQAGTGIDCCTPGLLGDVPGDTLGCTEPPPHPGRRTAAMPSTVARRVVVARTASDNTQTPSPVQW